MKTGAPTKAELKRGLGQSANSHVEADVLRAVLDWVNTLPNAKLWRQNTGGMEFINADGRKRYVKFGEPGQSDLTGMILGVRCEIEIKRPGKSPTLAQIAWIKFIRAKGGIGFWCDSLEACTNQLRDEFTVRDWEWDPKWEVL